MTTTAVAPLTIQDADALVTVAQRAAEAAGSPSASPSSTRAATSWPSGATTGPC